MDERSPVYPKDAYDELADLASRQSLDQGAIAPLAAVVSSDLKHRGRWADRLGDGAAAAKRETFGRGWMVIVALCVWLALLLVATMAVGWIMALPFAAVLAPVLVLEWHRRRSDRARRERAERPTCPRCGYDLSGLGDDLPREWVVGSSGPRRCPECGEAWPLVPRTD